MAEQPLKLCTRLSEEIIGKLIALREFEVTAFLIGQHIDLKFLTQHPNNRGDVVLTELSEQGVALIYKYGVVVVFHSTQEETTSLISKLQPFVLEPFEKPETESMTICIENTHKEGIVGNKAYISNISKHHLEVIGDAMSKSVVLDLYENKISSLFIKVDPIANSLMQTGKLGTKAKELLQHIGATLIMAHNMVGKVAVSEKPNLLWEQTHLEQLYNHLIDDFELKEREATLNQKMDLIAKTAETSLGVLEHRHSSRLEWYIIILISIEIGLTVYELFFNNWLAH